MISAKPYCIARAIMEPGGVPIEGAVTFSAIEGGAELHGWREEGETDWQSLDKLTPELIAALTRDAEEHHQELERLHP